MTAVVKGRDPGCRFAAVPEHLCVDYRGEPVRPGGECFAEMRSQAIEQGRVLHAAEGII